MGLWKIASKHDTFSFENPYCYIMTTNTKPKQTMADYKSNLPYEDNYLQNGGTDIMQSSVFWEMKTICQGRVSANQRGSSATVNT